MKTLNAIQQKQNVANGRVLRDANFSNVKNSVNADAVNYNVTTTTLQDVVNYSLKFYKQVFSQFGGDFRKEIKTQFALCVLNCDRSPLYFMDNNGNIVAKRALQLVKKSCNEELAILLCNVWQKFKEIEQQYTEQYNEVGE